ncbi:hypothetical protein D9M69_560550 [compost metagenome]
MKNATFCTAEQRLVGGKIKRTKRTILCDSTVHCRKQWHHARLAAFTGDRNREGGRVIERITGKAKRLRNAQAASVEKCQDSSIARGNPRFLRHLSIGCNNPTRIFGG